MNKYVGYSPLCVVLGRLHLGCTNVRKCEYTHDIIYCTLTRRFPSLRCSRPSEARADQWYYGREVTPVFTTSVFRPHPSAGQCLGAAENNGH